MRQWYKTFILLLVVTGLLHGQALAQAAFGDVEIAVDASGADAIEAKNKAIATGQMEAFKQLVDGYAPAEAKLRLLALDATAVGNMVTGYEMLEEKITNDRYRAKLKVHFDPASLRKQFGEVEGVNDGVLPASEAVLVLPVQKRDGQVVLWEPENSWRNVWNATALEFGRGSIILPFGDESDAMAVSASSVEAINFDRLKALAARYGTAQVVIITASYMSSGTQAIDVTIKRLGGVESISSMSYALGPKETIDMALLRVARTTAGQLQGGTAAAGVAGGAVSAANDMPSDGKVRAVVNISQPGQWNQLRAQLRSLPSVKDVDVVAVMQNQIGVVLYYHGNAEALARALVAQGLVLDDHGDYWDISIR